MMTSAAVFALIFAGVGHSAALIDNWDARLCETAQLRVAGANEGDFTLRTLYGEGNGFHVIQMDVEAAADTVVIATSAERARVGDETITTAVACKMVSADRIRDVLGLRLKGRQTGCREVNQESYRMALNSLSLEERRRFLAEGTPIRFLADYVTEGGGEWLPAGVEDFVAAERDSSGRVTELRVAAPAVRVPWNADERAFYQGTRHCKLLSAALLRQWMLRGSFMATPALFPDTESACVAPAKAAVVPGSCRFWFAPAQSYFCQDYTGPDWTPARVREECGRRHASPQALEAADSKYAGRGGVYSAGSCARRSDVGELGGACVFHCTAGDESVWRQSDGGGQQPAGGSAMMARACDLYLE